VQEESWMLLEELSARTPVRGAIIEHDANFPEEFAPILGQVARARSIVEPSARSTVRVSTPTD
jgi:uncharacterized protein (UPF0276 family)